MTAEEAEQAFAHAVSEAGLGDIQIPADGEWHAFAAPGNRAGRRSGSAKLTPTLGLVYDFRRGEKPIVIWRPNGALEHEPQSAEAKEARKALERESSQKAFQFWQSLTEFPDPSIHPYLIRKGMNTAGPFKKMGTERIEGLRVTVGTLVALVVDAETNEAQSLQFITPSGDKLLFPGAPKAGGMIVVHDADGPVAICEGIATAWSVATCTGMAAVAAVDCGNMKRVALALRAKDVQRRIILCADNNGARDPGVAKANEAALACGGMVAVAPLGCDFNDLHKRDGVDAVAEIVLRGAVQPAGRGGVAWRSVKRSGAPIEDIHNARLAIESLGIGVRHDVFRDRILAGPTSAGAGQEVQALAGDLTDAVTLRVRTLVSDACEVDFGNALIGDALLAMAFEHQFDPVLDMLDAAQAGWDGTERLDRMAVDYFNCDDTPLNRAIMRKTMIAAVRRARHPGCKHDAITVLESEEGYCKSTAWRVLAGDEFFSDASILGAGGREVQEQLEGAWIHENADLAGMRRTEVEHVKAFASRQVDIARPAYARNVKRQPRRSIEVATTNQSAYLQSDTGNRRFWPLRVNSSIDIERLRRDAAQLWGEAAWLEAGGEDANLDSSLWPVAAEAQEQRRVEDTWTGVVGEALAQPMFSVRLPDGTVYDAIRVVWDLGAELFVATETILTTVLGIPAGRQTKADAMRLASVMRQIGWSRPDNRKRFVDGVRRYGYVKLKTSRNANEE